MNPQELIANYEAKVQNFFRAPDITNDFEDPDRNDEENHEENNNETDSDCIERGSQNDGTEYQEDSINLPVEDF